MKKITKTTLLNAGPCEDGKKFLESQKSLKSAWDKCDRSEWMVWALSKSGMLDGRLARQFAVKCAEHTLHFFEDKYPDDKRPRLAIQAAQDFLDGKINDDARAAARAAAWAAAWAAAGDAAWAAAGAAARAAAGAAAWAAAEDAAWAAAEDAAGDAAGDAESQWQADVLRTLVDPFKK